MKKLDKLFEERRVTEVMNNWSKRVTENQIQKELDKIFDKNKDLQRDIKRLENYEKVEYLGDIDGIYSWVRCNELSEIKEEYREFLENYLVERCLRADFKNDCLMNYLGDDNLIVQDDTRHDNGVWQNHKCIIAESEYKNESGEIDESLRNQLIEKHMEKTGYFPNVFRVNNYDNIFLINTKEV